MNIDPEKARVLSEIGGWLDGAIAQARRKSTWLLCDDVLDALKEAMRRRELELLTAVRMNPMGLNMKPTWPLVEPEQLFGLLREYGLNAEADAFPPRLDAVAQVR